jgi:hypothetical protein
MTLPSSIRRSRVLPPGRSRLRPIFTGDLLTRTEPLAANIAFTFKRITTPLHSASGAARWFVYGSWAWITLKPGSRLRHVAGRGGVAVARFFLARPRLAQLAKRLLRRFPSVQKRLRRLLADSPRTFFQDFAHHNRNVENPSDLSPRARRVYAELKAAVAKHERNC